MSSAPMDMDQQKVDHSHAAFLGGDLRTFETKRVSIVASNDAGTVPPLGVCPTTVPLAVSSNVSATTTPSPWIRPVKAREGLVGCPVIQEGLGPTTTSDVTSRVGPYGSKKRLVMLLVFDATRIR